MTTCSDTCLATRVKTTIVNRKRNMWRRFYGLLVERQSRVSRQYLCQVAKMKPEGKIADRTDEHGWTLWFLVAFISYPPFVSATLLGIDLAEVLSVKSG